MSISQSEIERQIGYFQAMQSLMAAQAAFNRREDNEDGAHHCAGVAEGLGIGIVSLRCILEKDTVEGRRLESVK